MLKLASGLRTIAQMVKGDELVGKLTLSADGNGQVGNAGSASLTGVAEVGLTRTLSAAMPRIPERRSAHDRGCRAIWR